MSSEALRLAGELPSIDNLKRIAASNSPTAIQNALDNAIKWIQSLERELKFERAASFRDQIASLEAERDQLLAEVERLRKPLTPDELADLCESWLQKCQLATNIVDAFEAGARAIEAAKEAK